MRTGAGADRLALLGRHRSRAASGTFGAHALLLRRGRLFGRLLPVLVLAARRLRLLIGAEGQACARQERYYEHCAHSSLLTAHGARGVPGTHFATPVQVLPFSLSEESKCVNCSQY